MIEEEKLAAIKADLGIDKRIGKEDTLAVIKKIYREVGPDGEQEINEIISMGEKEILDVYPNLPIHLLRGHIAMKIYFSLKTQVIHIRVNDKPELRCLLCDKWPMAVSVLMDTIRLLILQYILHVGTIG